jgi:hypothetical protein
VRPGSLEVSVHLQTTHMSSKSGTRETARKPVTTRRHDSLADGAFGHETIDSTRSGVEVNRKISGEPSKQHSKYERAKTKTKNA